MKHIQKYYEMFFTEESRSKADTANIEFWNLLSDYDLHYPKADLKVIHTLNQHLGNYVELLEFQCCQESEVLQVKEIYNRHYYAIPLAVRTDLLKTPTFEDMVRHEDSSK